MHMAWEGGSHIQIWFHNFLIKWLVGRPRTLEDNMNMILEGDMFEDCRDECCRNV